MTTAAGLRPARRGCGRAQRGEVREPVEPPFGAVGHLAGEALHNKPVEQPRGVFDRNAQLLGERGRRQHGRRRQHVDRGGGM